MSRGAVARVVRLARSGGAALAPAALACGAVAALSFADGGYFERAWPPATISLAAAAALAVVAGAGIAVSVPQALFVGGLAALAAWQATSAAWSVDAERSLRDAERGLVYVAAALALVAVGRRGAARWLLAGVLVAAAGVSTYSVLGRALGGPEDVAFQAELLNRPLGYANALGLLAAMALVLAAGFALTLPPAAGLAVVAAAAPVAMATLVLTESRGSALAAGAGLATLAVFGSSASVRARAAWLAFLGALVAAVLAAPLAADPATLARRLGDRAYYWWTAWHALPERPLLGWGAGTFDLAWAAGAPVARSVRDAHSLYLDALVELGPFGLALVLVALGVPAAVAVAADTPVAATASAAYVAFLVHASFDWDWEVPAVAVAGLACGAAVLAEARAHARPADGPVFAAAAALLVLGVLSLAAGR